MKEKLTDLGWNTIYKARLKLQASMIRTLPIDLLEDMLSEAQLLIIERGTPSIIRKANEGDVGALIMSINQIMRRDIIPRQYAENFIVAGSANLDEYDGSAWNVSYLSQEEVLTSLKFVEEQDIDVPSNLREKVSYVRDSVSKLGEMERKDFLAFFLNGEELNHNSKRIAKRAMKKIINFSREFERKDSSTSIDY